jgi:hypothetical protein
MRDQGAHGQAPARGSFQGVLEFFPIQAKNQDIDTLLGVLDRREKRRDAVVGLYEQLQVGSSTFLPFAAFVWRFAANFTVLPAFATSFFCVFAVCFPTPPLLGARRVPVWMAGLWLCPLRPERQPQVLLAIQLDHSQSSDRIRSRLSQ